MSDTDRDAYAALIAALEATGAFRLVAMDGAEAGGLAASPSAFVAPGPWADGDTDDPATVLRRSTYRITLRVRAAGAIGRFAEADRLAGIVVRALAGATLGGGAIPQLSRIGRGACRPSAVDGEATCELDGAFSYLVTNPA